jgi:hypothetical protein
MVILTWDTWEVLAGTPSRRVEVTVHLGDGVVVRLLSWFCYLYPVTTCLQHKRSKVSRSILQSSLKALARFLILKCRLFVFRFLTDVRSLKAVLLGAAVTSSGNLFLFSSALTENEYSLGSILANWTASPCPLLPSVSTICSVRTSYLLF